MSESPPNPPAWHPDPRGRHELRWWDGERWTDHVSSQGVTGVDPVDAEGHNPVGGLFDQQVLVVNQKVKFIELENEYAVFDAHGSQVAAVRQIGQSTAKKVMRALTSLDQFMTHTLQIVDSTGQPQLVLTRPAKVVKSRVEIADAAGTPVGSIVQKNAIGKIRFSIEAGGQALGSINAENWRAWDFSIRDAADQEVARITKTWEGLAKTLFTTADNYVVHIHRPLEDPFRRLVVASALCVDTALKQDNRGFN